MSRTIVLASILKPVNDVRLYQKIGQSLAQHSPQDTFHFIGFCSAKTTQPLAKNVHFHPLYKFNRLSWTRLGAGIRFLRKLWRLKPQVVVVATFELLLPVYLYSWFRKVHIVYDVQENYYRNVRYTQVFAWWLRLPLAWGIRAIERLVHPKIRHYLLAEACYLTEMPFVQTKSTVVANKINRLTQVRDGQRTTGLLVYSGTVSEGYGVFSAIEWAKTLHQQVPAIRLVIVGHCPKAQDWQRLQQLATQNSFIQLATSRTPVPHARIIAHLQQAHFALLPYRVNQSVKNRIPTKFYECVALQTPMLVQTNEAWRGFIQQYDAGQLLDFDHLAVAPQYWSQACQQHFYQHKANTTEIYWETEEVKLLKVWEKIR
ncbi:glycosyltransferase family protein [Microscilla marina]|uniref:Glycosyl transferase, group 1 family protein n=1 Tax=Microscilla marina ATCC 23134 TaxID=313606 RepID=A1ZNW3_MICM2|nr:hypothetical protein [Microscilla marina]EAY28002.1 hypothetical protein M23134_02671 [Microscilla marina ATCC 23134]